MLELAEVNKTKKRCKLDFGVVQSILEMLYGILSDPDFGSKSQCTL